jgi:hypothetical protein
VVAIAVPVLGGVRIDPKTVKYFHLVVAGGGVRRSDGEPVGVGEVGDRDRVRTRAWVWVDHAHRRAFTGWGRASDSAVCLRVAGRRE